MRGTLRRALHPIRSWRAGERGASEVTAAIFILPLLIALVFVLIEVGFNIRYRGAVDNITQDTVRGIAHDGANYWAKSYTGPYDYAAPGQGWQAYAQARLVDLCKDGTSSITKRCHRAPTITCQPQNIQALPGFEAICTTTFYYKPVAGFMLDNPVMNLGFGGIWSEDNPITVTVEAPTTVGRGGE